MNKSIFFFLLHLSAMTSSAQKNTFDIINYTAPSDYELIKNDNVLTYYKEDKSTGAYCNFFIYKQMPGQGGVQQDFDYAWDKLVQSPFKFTSTANKQKAAILKGWQFLIGTTKYAENGVATMAMLITFTGENNMQNICILSNSDKYKSDIENFIASVDVAREISGTSTNDSSVNTNSNDKSQPSPSTQKQTIADALNDKGSKPEVWMKSRFEYDMMKSMSLTKYEWIAIYPDGKFYPYMPTEGYGGFYNNNKDWGTAKWSNNRLTIHEGNNNYYFDKKSAATMQSQYDSKPNYYKCKPVDGLRIEGAYTQYASLIPSDKNEAQYLIWFYKDGRFDDRGISVVNIKYPYLHAADAPGKGKYTIKNFSIILQYDDSRIKQLGFSGFLNKDPATVTDAYFIGRNLYYRKDKGFNSNLNQ